MKKLLPLLLFVSFSAGAVSVSPILEGKMCAFSFTYDDGTIPHCEVALPMHVKYGFPGTFLIITSRVEDDSDASRPGKCCSWNELREMADAGLEIASHTHSHKNMREIESDGVTKEMTAGKTRAEVLALREKNWPALLEEVTKSKKLIEDCTGVPVRTYAFAGNAVPDWSWRLMGEVGGCIRAGNIRIATGRGDTAESYRNQIETKVLVSNRFSCVMFHGLGTGKPTDGWNPVPSLEVYESMFKLVAERADRIHVDTYSNNWFYESLAKSVKLARQDDGSLLVAPAKPDPEKPLSGKVWLRLDPGERIEVNGKPVSPNAFGGVEVDIGSAVRVL